jgi:hypothetical protein
MCAHARFSQGTKGVHLIHTVANEARLVAAAGQADSDVLPEINVPGNV